LVELMVALVVLAVGILAVGQLLVTSRRHAVYGRHETMAVSLTQEIKERILSENFDDVRSIFDNLDTSDPNTINGSSDEWANHLNDLLGVNGRGTVDVIDNTEDVTVPDGMYRIEINISWVEGPAARDLPHTFMVTKVGI
jgi:hypothetical protein